jgi:signal transduction histidine kinase
MGEKDNEFTALAGYLRSRRAAVLEAWRMAIRRDPLLTTGEPLPRSQLFDHIPALLCNFERQLESATGQEGAVTDAAQQSAAAHGLQRWRQGYDLREVTRELGKLNECVVAEMDAYTTVNPRVSPETLGTARLLWATLCGTAVEESVSQYFQLQQHEADGQVRELESALANIQELEKQRADLWRQAAHDLRGNLGVVANATVVLAHGGAPDAKREDFVRILMRNVTTLHHLLDDVTSLARLQAGREQRQIEPLDVSPIVHQLCEGIRPLAQQRRLFLRSDGPAGFAAEGDAVKIRRIAQNLILNAVKFTHEGGITVSWGDSTADDPARWVLSVTDTGPGLPDSGVSESQPSPESGEGIGLSIVKRLCELLDATIEIKSTRDVGTSFRILFPRRYLQ